LCKKTSATLNIVFVSIFFQAKEYLLAFFTAFLTGWFFIFVP
jgi:hypothetical protein